MNNPNALKALATLNYNQALERRRKLIDFMVMAEARFLLLGFTREQYKKPDRHMAIATARGAVAVLLRDQGASWSMVAKCIGVSSHTSAMWAYNRGVTGLPRRKGAKAAVPKVTSTYELTEPTTVNS